jgi:ATP-dependent DNA ligase
MPYRPKAAKIDALKRFVPLASAEPSFDHVPKKKRGDTWSAGISEEEVKRFVWLRPSVKATVQYQEWTKAGYLRHARLRKLQN